MRVTREVPIITLRAPEAAKALGVSESWFNRNVAREVPRVQRSGMVLYTVDSLKKWADNNMDWGRR
jgi:predicted DNA-binding transcriptional regulator AlpA